jgi:tetratricopeptide (TPR) repeat protein
MDESYYWWYIYGHFGPGEDNLPCIGEVIAYYLELSDFSKQELAKSLQWTERYIEMLKSPNNKDMPKLLPRRILLAKALHIPPILLGLSSITLLRWSDGAVPVEEMVGHEAVAAPSTMQSYERLLALSWELYYTSTVQKAAESIEEALQTLNVEFAHASGIKRDQYDAMRCRFYQAYSVVLRDRMETDQAIGYENKAVTISLRLKNAELIASSLLRRARILIRQKKYDLALNDALNALPYADLSRDPLKGKCYQMAGEAQGYVAGSDPDLQNRSISFFNKAAQIARKGNLEPDGSFVKTDITSIFIEKAEALTLFGRYEDAHNALAIARKNLSPELTRWLVNLLLAEAGTYLAENDVDSCCLSLQEALTVSRAIQLSSKEQRVSTMYQQCKTLEPGNASLKKLEKALRCA